MQDEMGKCYDSEWMQIFATENTEVEQNMEESCDHLR